MIKKFIEKMQSGEQRKVFYAMLGGKLLGVGLSFLVVWAVFAYFGPSTPKAHADDAPAKAETAVTPPAMPAAPAAPAAAPDATPAYVNPLNTMWVLVAA